MYLRSLSWFLTELGCNLGLPILLQGSIHLVTDQYDRKSQDQRCQHLALWDWVSLAFESQTQRQREGFTLNIEHQEDVSGQCQTLAQGWPPLSMPAPRADIANQSQQAFLLSLTHPWILPKP